MSNQYSLKLEFVPMPPSCYVSSPLRQEFGPGAQSEIKDGLSCSYWSEALSNARESIQQEACDHERDEEAVLIDDSSSIEGDPRAPMMEKVLEELRCTDNILVTEIGRSDILDLLKKITVSNAAMRRNMYDACQCDCNFWDFQEEGAFQYLMEILQANMVHFLKFRYFDQERGRYYPICSNDTAANALNNEEVSCWAEETVIQDFLSVFTKAASSRYLPSRESIIECCFCDKSRTRNSSNATAPISLSTKIKRALVRLHRRAGIYFPHTKPTENHHEYWIALWWICSCILLWIIEPCVEITRLVDHRICRCHDEGQRSYTTSCEKGDICTSRPKKRQRFTNGFVQHSQSYMAKIPLELIRREVRKVGVPFESVLMHDGPWTSEDGDDADYIDANTASAEGRIMKGDHILSLLDSDYDEEEENDCHGHYDIGDDDSEEFDVGDNIKSSLAISWREEEDNNGEGIRGSKSLKLQATTRETRVA